MIWRKIGWIRSEEILIVASSGVFLLVILCCLVDRGLIIDGGKMMIDKLMFKKLR